MGDIVNGLINIHSKEPPIAHRDLKVLFLLVFVKFIIQIENILKGSDGKWKICDLGSSTT